MCECRLKPKICVYMWNDFYKSIRHYKISYTNLKLDYKALKRANFLLFFDEKLKKFFLDFWLNFERDFGTTHFTLYFRALCFKMSIYWVKFNVDQGLFSMFQGFKKATPNEPTQEARLSWNLTSVCRRISRWVQLKIYIFTIKFVNRYNLATDVINEACR